MRVREDQMKEGGVNHKGSKGEEGRMDCLGFLVDHMDSCF